MLGLHSRKYLGAVLATLSAVPFFGGGSAHAAAVSPDNPDGPIPLQVAIQNTPEGASSRILFRDGHATLLPTLAGEAFGYQMVVSGSAEAIIEDIGRGVDGKIVSAKVATGYVVACTKRYKETDVPLKIYEGGVVGGHLDGAVGAGVFGAYVQAFIFPAGLVGVNAFAAADAGIYGATGVVGEEGVTFKIAPGFSEVVEIGEKTIKDPGLHSHVGYRYANYRIKAEECKGSVEAVPYVEYTSSSATFDNKTTIFGAIVRLH